MYKARKAVSTRGAIFSILIILIVLLAGVGGYMAYQGSRKPSKTSGITLNIVVVGGWNQRTVQVAADDYEALHPDVHINLIITTFGNYLEKETVAESQVNASSYDIFTWSPTSSGPIASYVLPLNAMISSSGYNMSNFAQGMLSSGAEYYNATSKSTEIIGFPIDTSIYTLYYLKSIFDNETLAKEFEAEYHAPFNPTQWSNWTEAIWADQFVLSKGLAQYGMLIDDNPSHGMIDAFPAVFYWWYRSNSSLNGGTKGGLPGYNVMFTVSGQPDFAGPDGVAALEIYKQLVEYGDPLPSIEVVNYNTLESIFGSGKAAAEIGWTEYASSFNNSKVFPAVAGKVGEALLPGGYTEAGGCIMGIAKYASNKTAAFQFLEFLTSNAEAVKEYYAGGFVPTELGALQQLGKNNTIASFISLQYKGTLVAYANPPFLSISSTVLVPEFNDAINNYISGATISPQVALQTAASQWASALKLVERSVEG